MESMAIPATIPAFVKGSETCLVLAEDTSLHDDSWKAWRAAIAKETQTAQVRFIAGRTQICHKGGKQQVVHARPFRLDECWRKAGEFYSPEGLRDLIDRENKQVIEPLVAQLRSPVGVVPFVGAGLSMDFGVASWPRFLADAAEFHNTPDLVLAEIKAGRLIQAATLLAKDPDRFQAMVAGAFGANIKLQRVDRFAVGQLPMLAAGPVITTNFDSVLETVFAEGDAAFDKVITGTEPDNVVRAMQRNQHVLIKIHGDAGDRTARVFTGLEYDAQYKGISRLARVMFTNRPLLFLGCSLDKDRTLEVLEAIHQEIPGLAHYAIVAGNYGVSKTQIRRDELARYGIHPLWFAPGDFPQIRKILAGLVQEASTRLVWRNSKTNVRKVTARLLVRPKRRSRDAVAVRDEIEPVIRQLARRIVQGRLAFFLGAAAHLDERLGAAYFYKVLGEEYGFDEQGVRRADVAQYMIDQSGKSAAWATAKEILRSQNVRPSLVYQFLVELPGILRESGKRPASRQWLFTTNYDSMLEDVFHKHREQFHLFYYHVDGKDSGRFFYRDLHGNVRIIERPAHVTVLPEPAHVVVRLDGGIAWDRHIPETVTIAPMDFIISAGRLPTALPRALRSELRSRALLVLGSSLREAHVQRFIRWSAGTTRKIKTWAVVKDVAPDTIKYWRAAGVMLLDCDLKVFIPALRSCVLRLLQGTEIVS
jgi:hypothetical protein